MTYDLPMADQEEPHRARTHTGPVLVRLAKIDPVESDWRSSVMSIPSGYHPGIRVMSLPLDGGVD